MTPAFGVAFTGVFLSSLLAGFGFSVVFGVSFLVSGFFGVDSYLESLGFAYTFLSFYYSSTFHYFSVGFGSPVLYYFYSTGFLYSGGIC